MAVLESMRAREQELMGRRDHLQRTLDQVANQLHETETRLDECQRAIVLMDPDFAEVDEERGEGGDGSEGNGERRPRRDVRGEVRAYFTPDQPGTKGVTTSALAQLLSITPRSAALATAYLARKGFLVQIDDRWFRVDAVQFRVSEAEAAEIRDGSGKLSVAFKTSPALDSGVVSNGTNGHAEPAPVDPDDIERLVDHLEDRTATMLEIVDEGFSADIIKAAVNEGRVSSRYSDADGCSLYRVAA